MMWSLLLLMVWFPAEETPEVLIQQRSYLSAAHQLQERAHRLESPAVVRQYVVLVTEYYSSQLGWRTFFLKDLHKGERLGEMRAETQKVTLDTHGQLAERNLEVLVGLALEKWPENIEIKFTLAQYLYRGKCCLAHPKLKLEPTEMLRIFAEADKAGIHSAGSLLALGLEGIARKNFPVVQSYFERGLEMMPEDVGLLEGYVADLLRRDEYGKAIGQARKLFELAIKPELKADALLAAAQGLYGQQAYQEAADTALSVHRFMPEHAFALVVGLDSYRKLEDHEGYTKAARAFIDKDVSNPHRFQLYMDYLRLRGPTDDDRQLMEAYAREEDSEPIARITRLVNRGSFARLDGKTPQAAALIRKARELAGALNNPPSDLIPILDGLLKEAEKTQATGN